MITRPLFRHAPFWLSLTAILFSNFPAGAYEADTASRAAAERMLEKAGGRANWRAVHGARILAVNYFAQFELPAWFEFEIDFRSPYVRTRIAGDQLNRLRLLNGDSGWSMKDEGGKLQRTPLEGERLEQERSLWQGAFSRALYRIAIEDPSLRVVLSGADRLETHSVGGGLITWYKLGPDGFPVKFGIGDVPEAEGTKLLNTAQFGPYRLPTSGVSSDGSRFDTVSVRILTSPVRHVTEVPSSLDSVSWRLK
jgi:hypothetical protein